VKEVEAERLGRLGGHETTAASNLEVHLPPSQGAVDKDRFRHDGVN
jgi:hypothetical protein